MYWQSQRMVYNSIDMAKGVTRQGGVNRPILLKPAQALRVSHATGKKDLFIKVAQELIPQVNWKNLLAEEDIKSPNIQLAIQKMKKTSSKVTAEGVKGFLITIGYLKKHLIIVFQN